MFVSGIVCLYQFIGNTNAWLPVYIILIYKNIRIPHQETYECMYKSSKCSPTGIPVVRSRD